MNKALIVLTLFPTILFAEAPCSSTFDDFLSKFEKNSQFQLESINYPLKYSFIDLIASPEPKIINTLKSKSDLVALNEQVYPSILTQQKKHLIKQVQSPSKVNKIIQLHKPDTDYKVNYHFKKIDSCWKLNMFESTSL